jgi:4-aminobutyrate aminotransferase-like enzyme
MTNAALIERRDRALGAGAPLFYRQPLHIVRGEGVQLFDDSGRAYVDMYNNVPCVGHAHPRVVAAMAAQQATLNVHSRYLHEGVVAFAERLTALHGGSIQSVVFSCSGTEAKEVAQRMARLATGRHPRLPLPADLSISGAGRRGARAHRRLSRASGSGDRRA